MLFCIICQSSCSEQPIRRRLASTPLKVTVNGCLITPACLNQQNSQMCGYFSVIRTTSVRLKLSLRFSTCFTSVSESLWWRPLTSRGFIQTSVMLVKQSADAVGSGLTSEFLCLCWKYCGTLMWWWFIVILANQKPS